LQLLLVQLGMDELPRFGIHHRGEKRLIATSDALAAAGNQKSYEVVHEVFQIVLFSAV
jgi:hypothetical protein